MNVKTQAECTLGYRQARRARESQDTAKQTAQQRHCCDLLSMRKVQAISNLANFACVSEFDSAPFKVPQPDLKNRDAKTPSD